MVIYEFICTWEADAKFIPFIYLFIVKFNCYFSPLNHVYYYIWTAPLPVASQVCLVALPNTRPKPEYQCHSWVTWSGLQAFSWFTSYCSPLTRAKFYKNLTGTTVRTAQILLLPLNLIFIYFCLYVHIVQWIVK